MVELDQRIQRPGRLQVRVIRLIPRFQQDRYGMGLTLPSGSFQGVERFHVRIPQDEIVCGH